MAIRFYHIAAIIFILTTFTIIYLIPYIFLLISIINGEVWWAIFSLIYFLAIYQVKTHIVEDKFFLLAN